jgi:hypothetical protein
MFRKQMLKQNQNYNTKEQLQHNESITMETIVKLQKHKFNPHEPTFLNRSQFEELCKSTYDGNVPFTITRLGDTQQEGVQETKTEEVTETKTEEVTEEKTETYKYKKPVKRIKKEKK